MDFKALYEENKKTLLILSGIILIFLIIVIVFGSGSRKKEEKVLEIKFNDSNIQIEENKTYQVKYTILPTTIEEATLTWSSTNDNVATVDENGLITAITPGSVVIVGKAESGAYDNIDVTVVPEAKDNTAIKFNIENFDLKIATSRRLYPIFTNGNSDYKSIEWSSSNELVATVTQNGMVTGIKEGKTVITARIKLNDDTYLSTSSNVTVTKKTTLSLSKGSTASIENGNSAVLNLTISDKDVVVKQIVGDTANNNIAQIIRRPIANEDGTISLTVKAIGIGKTNLTFNMETADGELVTLTVPVTVK